MAAKGKVGVGGIHALFRAQLGSALGGNRDWHIRATRTRADNHAADTAVIKNDPLTTPKGSQQRWERASDPQRPGVVIRFLDF